MTMTRHERTIRNAGVGSLSGDRRKAAALEIVSASPTEQDTYAIPAKYLSRGRYQVYQMTIAEIETWILTGKAPDRRSVAYRKRGRQ